MATQFTIEFKRTHSTEFAERCNLKPDRWMAMVFAPEYREDGSSWNKLHHVVEAKMKRTVQKHAEDFILQHSA